MCMKDLFPYFNSKDFLDVLNFQRFHTLSYIFKNSWDFLIKNYCSSNGSWFYSTFEGDSKFLQSSKMFNQVSWDFSSEVVSITRIGYCYQTHLSIIFHRTNHKLLIIWLSETRNLSNNEWLKVWLKWTEEEIRHSANGFYPPLFSFLTVIKLNICNFSNKIYNYRFCNISNSTISFKTHPIHKKFFQNIYIK